MWRTHLAGFSVQFVVCRLLAVIKLMLASGPPRHIRSFHITILLGSLKKAK